MSQTRTVRCLSEALSPITHASGVEGNESIVMREAVATARGTAMVPCLSGNALRHRAVREPGMRWLIAEYGLGGKLTLPQLNFLLHGGALTKGGAKVDAAGAHELGRLFPLGRLLGGCLPDQIVAGSLHTWRGTLACEENREAIARILPPGVLPDRLRPAESFVSGYQYTRSDAAKTAPAEAGATASGTGAGLDSNLMIFAGQAVMRGAAFVHGFVVRHGSPVELGALLWSLRLWQASGGTVGGQAARGHGRLGLELIGIGEAEQDEACGAYLEHVRGARDEAVGFLRQTFAPAPRSKTGAAT